MAYTAVGEGESWVSALLFLAPLVKSATGWQIQRRTRNPWTSYKSFAQWALQAWEKPAEPLLTLHSISPLFDPLAVRDTQDARASYSYLSIAYASATASQVIPPMLQRRHRQPRLPPDRLLRLIPRLPLLFRVSSRPSLSSLLSSILFLRSQQLLEP
jgi:hypothetical protein